MKKYLLLIFITFTISPLFGQLGNNYKINEKCTNNSNVGNTLAEQNVKGSVLSYKSTVHKAAIKSGKLIHDSDLKRNHVHETFFFDNNGNLKEILAQYLYEANVKIQDNLIKIVYKFNSYGQNIEESTYKVKDSIETLLRSNVNVFDSIGNKIEIIKYEKSDIKTRVVRKKEKDTILEYYYNADGKTINYIISLKYDNNGNEIERINLDSSNKNIKSIEYKNYDSNNNEIGYSYEGPIGKFKCEFKYDTFNNIIEKKCSSKSGFKYDHYKYIYDDNCNWIQKIETIDNKLDNVTIRVYEYL